MPGLVTVKTHARLEADEQAQNIAPQAEPVLGALVGQVHDAWSRNKRARQKIGQELLACLRQRNSEYDPEELSLIQEHGGGNTIYMGITATKCAAAAAWIGDVLLPPDDLPVGVEATPDPELPAPVYAEMIQRVMAQVEQQGQQGQRPAPQDIQAHIDAIEADVKTRIQDKADERAEGMTRRITDILDEGGFRDAMDDFIEDFVTYPTAILKGPVYRRVPKIEWGAYWQPRVADTLVIEIERVSPFDLYPSPNATTCDDGELIERLRMTRAQLTAMRGRPGYDTEAIERILRDDPDGYRVWLWTDTERESLENKQAWWLSPPGTIDALHYWGMASGKTLMEWGLDGLDEFTEYHVEAIVIDRECIRCVINNDPLGRRPYQAASFRRVPGAFWGQALPYLLRDTQKMCNAVARALADNLGLASGPQIVVNADAMAEGEDITNIYPRKIWQVSYNPDSAGSSQPVNFFQPSSNANELLGVFAQFEQRADDESSIPRYTYGNEKVGGAGSTASGLSMLFDATAKGIRKAIGHVDHGVLRPLVSKIWLDEMRYGHDPTIKGDAEIVARGAAALLIKDQALHRQQEFMAATANPFDMGIIGESGRAELLRSLAKHLNMDADKVVPPQSQIEHKPKQPDPKLIKAQADAQAQQAQLQLQQQKQQNDAAQANAQLAETAQKDAWSHAMALKNFKLDTARYLSDQEEAQFKRRMGLALPEHTTDNL